MELVTTELKAYVESTEDRSDSNMARLRVKFKNGLGISIIQGAYSYGGSEGLYEIAPLNRANSIDGSIIGIVDDDVIGRLTLTEVSEYAKMIALKQ